MHNKSYLVFAFVLLSFLFSVDARSQEKDCQPEFKIRNVTNYPCYSIGELGYPKNIEGVVVEFYRYKAPWPISIEQTNLIVNAEEAFYKSIATLKKYGTVPHLKVLFTNELPDNLLDAQAEANWPNPKKPSCEITIYLNTESNVDYFKQVVAHEVAHCFQGENIKNIQESYHGGYNRWWVEGGADYLANVIFPAIDQERNSQSAYEPTEVVFNQKNPYSTSLFFQWLENKGWNIQTYLDTFKTYPLGDTEVDLAAIYNKLSAWSDIADIFHFFTRTFYSPEPIIDSSGKPFRLKKPDEPSQTYSVTADTKNVTVKSFAFRSNFAVIVFSDAGSYKMKMNPLEQESLRVSYRKFGTTNWTLVNNLEAEIQVECDSNDIAAYEFIVTSTQPSADPLQVPFEIEVTGAKKCECTSVKPALDPCLIGYWQLDMDNYRSVAEPLFNGMMKFSGSYAVDIRQGENQVTGYYKDFAVTIAPIQISPDQQTAEYKTVYNGTTKQTYFAKSANKICGRLEAKDLIVDDYENGQLTSSEPDQSGQDPELGGVAYFCSGNQLNLKIQMPGMQDVGDTMVVFRKVQKPPQEK